MSRYILISENSVFRPRWHRLDGLADILLSGQKQICYLQVKLDKLEISESTSHRTIGDAGSEDEPVILSAHVAGVHTGADQRSNTKNYLKNNGRRSGILSRRDAGVPVPHPPRAGNDEGERRLARLAEGDRDAGVDVKADKFIADYA